MESNDVILTATLFALLAFIIVLTIEWGTIDTDATVKLKEAKAVVVIRQGDVYALLTNMRIVKTSTGVCNTIYASSQSSNEVDVIVMICGKYAYVYYLR
jgi:hypothetical protein